MSKQTEPTHLEDVIDRTLTYLDSLQPDSPEFARTVDQLDKLTKMLPKKEPFIKPETLIPVLGNLGGIFAIMSYESFGHVISTKALGFVTKSRI